MVRPATKLSALRQRFATAAGKPDPQLRAEAQSWRDDVYERERSAGPPDPFARAALYYVTQSCDALTSGPRDSAKILDRAETELTRLAEARREKQQMVDHGISDRQAKGHVPWLSERLLRTVPPYGYFGHWSNFLHNKPIDREEHPYSPKHPRFDTWRLYLGLPQENGHVEVSAYAPPSPLKTTTPTTVYYRLRDVGDAHARLVAAAVRAERSGQKVAEDGFFGVRADPYQNGVMGRFLVGIGQDNEGEYASYYDRWDLDPAPFLRMEWVVGKPLEFYDRIHFDRPTVARIIELEDVIALERKKAPLSDSCPELEDDLSSFGINLEHYARETVTTNPVVRAAVLELAKLDRRYDFEHQPEFSVE